MKIYIRSLRGRAATFGLASLLTLSACEQALDINQDPNNPPVEQGTPELVFPAAVASTAGALGGEYAILGGIWAQYWTQSSVASQYRDFDSYNVTQTNLNGRFNEVFSGALNDYHFVIQKAQETENWHYLLMGTVMKAYTYQLMVDLYDTLPYSEAFQGVDNLTPAYEGGYEIYKKLIAELDNAIAQEGVAGAVDPSKDKALDVIFRFNMDSWIKFANTLKLKLYLRMVYAQPAEAEAGIRAMYDSGAQFLDTDAQLAIFENSQDKSNPFYEFNFRRLNTTTNLRASVTFLSFLQANGDPRIGSYFTPTTGTTTYSGNHQGDFNNPDPALADISVARATAVDPVHFISEAESYFLQAEALERYYAGAGAKDMYDKGVEAAFAQYGVAGQAADFTAAGGVYAYPVGDFETKLEAIIVQKWASFPGAHALEGFIEKNRTGYPKTSPVYSTDISYIAGQLVYPKNGVTAGQYPKRLIIPQDERNRNPNVPAIVPITTNVWWDQK
ncbi:SusD/RagB family nutrient-binding outer membrane lipoprotein [Parapedobacter lycopersici]|uniref:SusD/RagB family nutrient-binding outer membrane lipoprotein n=1 Tax=Parapedobacter lycopersici TaxID=1864939 RepID=UPI003340CD8E